MIETPTAPPSTLYQVVQTLLNDDDAGGLTLLVHGTPVFCHRAVLVPASGYVRDLLEQPGNGLLHEIDLTAEFTASFEVPLRYRAKPEVDAATWLQVYLQVVYGVHTLSADRPEELFAIATIADFLRSPDVAAVCDRLLSAIKYSPNDALSVAILCQKRNSLPMTLQATKTRMSKNLHCLCEYARARLGNLLPNLFTDIIRWATSPYLQFYALCCYTALHGAGRNMDPFSPLYIRVENLLLFTELLSNLSPTWNLNVADRIFQLVSDEKRFDPSDPTRGLIFKTLCERYFHLRNPPRTEP